MKRISLIIVVLFCMVSFTTSAASEKRTIVLATTTSTYHTGLLDKLLPAFTKFSGIKVTPIAVGTDKALELGRNGDADVVMVHARDLEDRFMKDGYGTYAWTLMFNDFVLLGPSADPAGAKKAHSIIGAMKRIASGKTRFVSRADRSGTHHREKQIWEVAGCMMPKPLYVEAGQGMAPTLVMAGEMQAYVLCDRATFISLRKNTPLEIVYQNPEELKNVYGIIAVSDKKIKGAKTELAREFIDWIISEPSIHIIKNFRMKGELLFHPSVARRLPAVGF